MTEQEIIEGNKIIAEFIGIPSKVIKYTINPEDPGLLTFGFPRQDLPPKFLMFKSLEELQYHKSWDWLMLVVEEIEKDLNKKVIIGGSDWCKVIRIISTLPYEEYEIVNECSLSGKKIEAVWLAIVKYIKYTKEIK